MSDERDRSRIFADLDTNLVVEASAGTGKTFSLVGRIASLVRSGKAGMHQVAAVTFTRKAAAQLRERLSRELARLLREQLPEAERERIAAARDELDRAFLGTIHAFCSRLIRERPVEAGIAPDFREPDEDEASLLRESSWGRSLEKLRANPGPLDSLIALGVEPHRLREAYARICEFPEVAAVAVPVPAPDFSDALARAKGFLDDVLPVLQGLGRAKTPDEMAKAAWAAHFFRSNRDLSAAPAAAEFLSILRASKATQKNWPDRARAKNLSDRLKALQNEWIEPVLRQWFAHCHLPVMEFLSQAAADFRAARLAAGRPSFTDLLLLCRDMLRDSSPVRRHFRARYPRLLVDEFQDTDPIQAEVVLYLTAEDLEERDWRKIAPRPGALFVVGDPKQSIYRFRRADIDTYDDVRGIVEKTGGAVVRLSKSFRSSPRVCEFVNGVFSEHFRPGVAHQAQDVPLEAVRAEPEGSLPSGAYGLVHRLEGSRQSSVWDADARAVAAWIAAAVGGGGTISLREDGRERTRAVRPGDFLVILRNAGKLDAYARALEAVGIPTAVAGGKAFRDSAEVRAFVPFLQALADPADPVPVVAFLRGPSCGVDDDALYRFRAAGGRFAFWSDPPEGSDPRILRAFEQIRQGREWAGRLPPGAAIGRIADFLGVLPEAYADDVGERRAGNLEKALGMARRLSSEGKPFAEVVAALAELLERAEAPEMTIDPVKENAVRITNLHKAKGLEAPIVFLAGPLHDSRRDGAVVSIDRSAEPPAGHFLILDDRGTEVARPADWEDRKAIESKHDAAEKARLLYVAATRAMNTLVVSGWIDTTTKKENIQYGPWKDLVLSPLPDLPPLPEVARPGIVVPTIDPGAYLIELDAIGEGLASSSRPTYAASSPSKFEGRGKFAPREETGKGMAWGRILHRLLEVSMRRRAGKTSRDREGEIDLSKYAENLLREEEREIKELPELLETLRGVSESELWNRAKASPQCLVEVPFATVVHSAAYGLPDPPEETLLNGTIDLVFKEDGVWKLIDYKSDAISGSLADLVAFYEPQLRAYRDEWQKITGQKTEAGLYFIANATVEWLKSSSG